MGTDAPYRCRVVVTALDDRRPLTVVTASGTSVAAGGQVVVAIDNTEEGRRPRAGRNSIEGTISVGDEWAQV